MLKFNFKKKTLATVLSASLLLSAISVPLSISTAAQTVTKEKSFNFGDKTTYSGGRIHKDDMWELNDGFKGLTGNSKDDTVNIMEIQGLFDGGDNSKNNAFWYFYNDKKNASGFGYDPNGKQFLVTTCIDSTTARRIPTLDYSAKNDSGSTITAYDKPTTGVIITTDAVGGETEDTVPGISGKLRLATPVYNTTNKYYTKGAPVLDGTCGTTFLVAKKDNATIKGYDSAKFTGTVYQVVTVNLGYDKEDGITLGAKASALQQFTNNNIKGNSTSFYYSVGSAYMKTWEKKAYLSQVDVASKTGSGLADLAVNGDGTALTDAEKNAVATYFQSLTGLKKAMDTNTDEYANRLDDYIVDYKVYSPETGKYRILLGLNINGYDEYCKENGDMPEKLAIALDGDYFNTDIATVNKAGKTKVTVDTPAYGIGSYNGVAINTAASVYTNAKCANTLIADMTIAYETEVSEEEDTTIDNLKIDALGAAVRTDAKVGAEQSLRFGFDYTKINSAISEADSSVTLKEYGVIIKSGTQTKDTLKSSGQKVSVTDFNATPLTNELTLVITNSDENSQIRVSAVAYAIVEYKNEKYTIYSDNDDDKVRDGVATKSVMGVMKAEMKMHTSEDKFTTAVEAANKECETSLDATVLDKTSTEDSRQFIKWLFYYYFNPVQA